ncbi:MAG: alpha/beta hydrolase family protein [Deltaproteobacteria bacterium]
MTIPASHRLLLLRLMFYAAGSCSAMASIACVAMLLSLAAGCTPAVTDVATISAPGRYEVSLHGSGVTLGGILFRPAGTSKPLPAIIVIHGWAQPGVIGASRVEGTARRLAEQGYVALALSMRGWPPSSGWDDCGRRQPDDIAKAADWLATLPGVNADSIGVLGFSLGGQVALLSGARSSRIKAIVAYFPITDIHRWRDTTSNRGIRYFYVPLVCGTGDQNSPVHVAEQIHAPVLLIHGDRDTEVPTEQSLEMRDALRKVNRHVELLVIDGGNHRFKSEQSNQAWFAATKFFSMYLGARE